MRAEMKPDFFRTTQISVPFYYLFIEEWEIFVCLFSPKNCVSFSHSIRQFFLSDFGSSLPTKWSNQNLPITNKHTIIFAQYAFRLVLLFIALGFFVVDTVRLFYFIFCLYCSAADYYRSMQISLIGISGNKIFILKKKIRWYKYSTKFTIVTIFLNFFLKFVKEFHMEFNTNLRFSRKRSSVYEFLPSFESIIF